MPKSPKKPPNASWAKAKKLLEAYDEAHLKKSQEKPQEKPRASVYVYTPGKSQGHVSENPSLISVCVDGVILEISVRYRSKRPVSLVVSHSLSENRVLFQRSFSALKIDLQKRSVFVGSGREIPPADADVSRTIDLARKVVKGYAALAENTDNAKMPIGCTCGHHTGAMLFNKEWNCRTFAQDVSKLGMAVSLVRDNTRSSDFDGSNALTPTIEPFG